MSSTPTYKIVKFEKIETPHVAIFFTVQKTPESRAYLLQAQVPLHDHETCTDEELCDAAWESVKDEASRYLAEDKPAPVKVHPLVQTEYVPKSTV
jgi:hypothetical protein